MIKESSRSQLFNSLLERISRIVEGPVEAEKKLLDVCRLLKESVAYYDWVGFYLVDSSVKRELLLGPFAGEETEHTRIPFGKGICGQAAEREETFLVQDVSREANYLSCSSDVKSEIVVPIFKSGRIAGEIDIDSHQLSRFTQEDRIFLEKVAETVSELI